MTPNHCTSPTDGRGHRAAGPGTLQRQQSPPRLAVAQNSVKACGGPGPSDLAHAILAGVALKSQRRGRAAAQRQAIRGQGRFYMGRSLYQGRQRVMPLHGPTVLRPCAATNGHEDRDDAVAQGGESVLVHRGAGEVAGSSPASVTISMKKERLASNSKAVGGGQRLCLRPPCVPLSWAAIVGCRTDGDG